jgi:hypothetical protein
MKIYNFKSYLENFLPKKVEERGAIRKNRLLKEYNDELNILKNIIQNLNWTYVEEREFLKDKKYHHYITNGFLYFITLKNKLEIPLEIVDWRLWVDRLIKIGFDEYGELKTDYEFYEKSEITLKKIIDWISWYFEISYDEVKKYYDANV